MDERERQLLETRRAEALALFEASQTGRATGERIAALVLTLIGVTVAAGIDAHSDRVALPLPPVVLLLVSYAFQQYVDVTVAGVARATLERLLATDLQGHGLIYEYAVAGIRTSRPLVISVRVLQTMTGLVVGLVIAVGVYVAVQGQPWYIEVGFGVGTGFGSVSAALSYWDMLRSGRIARARIEVALGPASDDHNPGGEGRS
jgi:hypothetical protein